MGKVIKDEDLKLNIIVNGNQGLKELGELDNAARKLTNETKQLATEKKKLIATGKHETETYKKVTSELRKNEEAQQKLIKAHKTETDEYAQLSEAIKKNKAEKRQLENSNRRYTQEYQSITTAIKANNLAITENKEKMKVLKKQVGLTGLTMKQLRREATFLRNKLDNVIPETRAWKKYRADLKKVETTLGIKFKQLSV